MSIRQRIFDLARANITDFRDAFSRDRMRDLLSRDTDTDDDHDPGADQSVGAKAGRRVREFRDAAEEAWERAYENAKHRTGVNLGDPERDHKRWYRILELEPGASTDEIRRAYRRMLKRYHPDRFAADPEKFAAASEVARQITEAHDGLIAALGTS